jgi:hypothetical protein
VVLSWTLDSSRSCILSRYRTLAIQFSRWLAFLALWRAFFLSARCFQLRALDAKPTPSRHVRLLNTDTSSHFLVIYYLSPPELTCATLPRYNGDALIHGGGDDLVEGVRDERSCAGRHVARAAAGGKEVDGEGGFGNWYDKLVRSVSLHVGEGDNEGKRKSCEAAFACVPRAECNYPDNQHRASGYSGVVHSGTCMQNRHRQLKDTIISCGHGRGPTGWEVGQNTMAEEH